MRDLSRAGNPAHLGGKHDSPAPTPACPQCHRWLNHQPYLLLNLMSLFWGRHIVLGRYVAGTCRRWHCPLRGSVRDRCSIARA
jgi:hypothetical protein